MTTQELKARVDALVADTQTGGPVMHYANLKLRAIAARIEQENAAAEPKAKAPPSDEPPKPAK